MTFIASVIAKKGVALIADSLVTSMERVIEYDSFMKYLVDKVKGVPVEEIKFEPQELVKLFDHKPSHTKDYEEKLFQYDKYTAITTAGSAAVNGKRIEYLVREMIEKNKKDRGYNRKKIETKVKEFVDFLNQQAEEHLQNTDYISYTTFIMTHYDKAREQSSIYKIDINPCLLEDIKSEPVTYVNCRKMDDYFRVVCDGQNRISERILFGETEFFIDITPKIIHKVLEKLGIEANKMPEHFFRDVLTESKNLLPSQFWEDMKINRLADLSLQQAVDLASLLMKIEINFQRFTENIPTVGGVIKLAIINKDGFQFITGNEILKSDNIH